MGSWGQFWHGYWTAFILTENNVFTMMDVPSGWKRELVLKCLGRTIWSVYPVSQVVVSPGDDSIL